MTPFQEKVAEVCDEIKDLLIRKNQDYGNSVAEPIGVFSRASPIDQIHVRIDDKLNRIRNISRGHDPSITEDTIKDLIGYLVLLRVVCGTRGDDESTDTCA